MIYAHVAAALLAAVIAATGAWRVQDWRYSARDAQRLEAEREVQRNNAKAAHAASQQFEKDRQHVRVVYQPIETSVERIVERPVYRDACFDADGLRELHRAVDLTATGQSGGAVPAPR